MSWLENYISKFGDTMDVEPKEYVDSINPSDELIDIHEFWGDRCVIRYNLVKKHLGHLQMCIVDVLCTDDVVCNGLRDLRNKISERFDESCLKNSAYGDLIDAELSFITGNMKASQFRTILNNFNNRLK